jgi:hypothetical protein
MREIAAFILRFAREMQLACFNYEHDLQALRESIGEEEAQPRED